MVARALGLDPDDVLDLSMSLNPFAPDVAPTVTAEIARGALRRYPDRSDVVRATAALAAVLEVDERRIVLTNGGAEAIALVAAALGRGWVDEPDFSLYRRHLDMLDPDGPRFRSDPHNPTGRLAGDDESAAVWDEAFYPLATGRWTRHAAVAGAGAAAGAGEATCSPTESTAGSRSAHTGQTAVAKIAARDQPAVVVGSLTKVLGCPGLRLGYVMVPPDDGAALGVTGLRDRLVLRQPQWSVGTPALGALPTLLAMTDLPAWASAIRTARAELCTALCEAGLAPLPSEANFVLVEGGTGLRDRLAREGVIVRECSSFGLEDRVRIAVPDEQGLARLVAALERSSGSTTRTAARA
jgi:histidinol-phosphate/aromatic aminotransferase/cobyric acid decarboxylase-like protein